MQHPWRYCVQCQMLWGKFLATNLFSLQIKLLEEKEEKLWSALHAFQYAMTMAQDQHDFRMALVASRHFARVHCTCHGMLTLMHYYCRMAFEYLHIAGLSRNVSLTRPSFPVPPTPQLTRQTASGKFQPDRPIRSGELRRVLNGGSQDDPSLELFGFPFSAKLAFHIRIWNESSFWQGDCAIYMQNLMTFFNPHSAKSYLILKKLNCRQDMKQLFSFHFYIISCKSTETFAKEYCSQFFFF